MNQKTPTYIGISLGILYGLALRLLWEWDPLVQSRYGGLVTISFVFLVPFVIGFIRIHFEYKVDKEISSKLMILMPWEPIFVFLFVTVITFLEGSICIILTLPAFMLFSSLGGLTAGYLNRYLSKRKDILLAIMLLPLLMAPIELNSLELSRTYEVTDFVIIDTPREAVWAQLTNVPPIEPHEFSNSITSYIGIPKPISADMQGTGIDSIRVSRWDKGISFNEIITEWEPSHKLAFKFDIDPDLIPDDALDKHVKLGSDYFSPLTGYYRITEIEGGKSRLELSTTIRDNTNFGIYSRIWGEIIFQDFHHSLLNLMKNRAEAAHHTAIQGEKP